MRLNSANRPNRPNMETRESFLSRGDVEACGWMTWCRQGGCRESRNRRYVRRSLINKQLLPSHSISLYSQLQFHIGAIPSRTSRRDILHFKDSNVKKKLFLKCLSPPGKTFPRLPSFSTRNPLYTVVSTAAYIRLIQLLN